MVLRYWRTYWMRPDSTAQVNGDAGISTAIAPKVKASTLRAKNRVANAAILNQGYCPNALARIAAFSGV